MTVETVTAIAFTTGLLNAAFAGLLMIVAAMACRFCKSPTVGSVLWTLVFLKLITPPFPLVPIHIGDRSWFERPPVASSLISTDEVAHAAPANTEFFNEHTTRPTAADVSSTQNAITVVGTSQDSGHRFALPSVEFAVEKDSREREERSQIPAITQRSSPNFSIMQTRFSKFIPLVAIVWLIGSIYLAMTAAIRLIRFRRLLQQSEQTPQWIIDEIQTVSRLVGLRTAPRVQAVNCHLPPSVGCWGLRPTILLPKQFYSALSAIERRSLLAHELAHVYRVDHWRAWLELIAVIAFWWYPLVWLARRESRRVTERCCDGWVLKWFPDSAAEYAETLLKSVDFVSSAGQGMPEIIHGIGEYTTMKTRILTILAAQTRPSLSRSERGLLAIIIVFVLASGFQFAPPARNVIASEERATEKASEQTAVIEIPRTIPKIGDRVYVIDSTEVRGEDQKTWTIDRGSVFIVQAVNEEMLVIKGEAKSDTNNIHGQVSGRFMATAEDAIRLYGEQIQRNPQDATAYMARGLVELNEHEVNAAIEDLNKSIRLEPQNSLAFVHRGRAWNLKKNYEKAISDCSEAIRLDPNNLAAYRCRIGAAFLLEHFEQAQPDIDEMLRRCPEDMGVSGLSLVMGMGIRQQKQHEKQLAALDKTTTIPNCPDPVGSLLKRAEAYRELKECDKALSQFTEVIRIDPRHLKAHQGRGEIWFGKHDFDQAIPDFTSVIEVDPQKDDAFVWRGRCWNQTKNYDAAITDFTEAIRLNPKSSLAFYERGLAWEQKHNDDQAIADYTSATRVANHEVKLTLGVGLGNTLMATSDFGSQRRASAFLNRGRLYEKRQQFDKALNDYNASLKQAPKESETNCKLAWLLASCPDENCRNGTKAVEFGLAACKSSNWEDALAIQSLAAAYAETGEFAKAVETQTKANKLLGESDSPEWKTRLELYKSGKPYRMVATQIADRDNLNELK